MIAFLKRLWAAAPIATAILSIAIAAGLYFGVRMVAFWIYWHDVAHLEQDITAWMTPNYISMSWRVPKEVVLDALDVPMPHPNGPMNLNALAAYHGVTVEQLINTTQDAITAFRVDHPPKVSAKP